MLQITSAHEVCTSAFQSRLASRCALPDASSFRAICVPVRGHLLDGVAGRCDFGGLILARSRLHSPGLLTRLMLSVRSCDLALMDVGPDLEASFLAFILFCSSLSYLCRENTVALEC
jgi:hypothetical protein